MSQTERPLVYLDCETLSLHPEMHHVWEISWAVEDGPIQTIQVDHTLRGADQKAMQINRYIDRVEPIRFARAQQVSHERDWKPQLGSLPVALWDDLRQATVVGQNPGFDMYRLSRRWMWQEPWHYRPLDIASMAAQQFRWRNPKGLAGLVDFLNNELGFNVPVPDHTSAGDVAALRGCHQALITIRG